jgi:hypothetical protein
MQTSKPGQATVTAITAELTFILPALFSGLSRMASKACVVPADSRFSEDQLLMWRIIMACVQVDAMQYLMADVWTIFRRVLSHPPKVPAVVVAVQQLIGLHTHPWLAEHAWRPSTLMPTHGLTTCARDSRQHTVRNYSLCQRALFQDWRFPAQR